MGDATGAANRWVPAGPDLQANKRVDGRCGAPRSWGPECGHTGSAIPHGKAMMASGALATDALARARMIAHASEFAGQVGVQLRLGLLDLGHKLLTAVDQRDCVDTVAAAQIVLLAATFERLDLCGQTVGGLVLHGSPGPTTACARR